jgi:hypothetical protein
MARSILQGLGGFCIFRLFRVQPRETGQPRRYFPVIPFKNRRFLPSAALRRGDDFGMVPPI